MSDLTSRLIGPSRASVTTMANASPLFVGSGHLPADLDIPPAASGIVIFAHGSGSSRKSPRNMAVARALNASGLATLLFDLLTPAEDLDRRNVFDIELLGTRMLEAIDAVRDGADTGALPIGLFGASTGAAAALLAAARRPDAVAAVVSRGGRPDLARSVLRDVRAPTLLIVGGYDEVVIDMNQTALAELGGIKRLEIVPGATHLFEEPGTLERVVALATDWFIRHLVGVSP